MLIKPMQNTVKHVGPDAHVTLTLHVTDGLTFDLRDRGTGCRPEPCTPATACATSATASAPSAAPSPSTPTPAPAYSSTDTYRHENQDPGPQGAGSPGQRRSCLFCTARRPVASGPGGVPSPVAAGAVGGSDGADVPSGAIPGEQPWCGPLFGRAVASPLRKRPHEIGERLGEIQEIRTQT